MIERAAPYKSEYYNGEIFALAGASDNHNTIALNVASALNLSLRDKECFVYSSDMRLAIPSENLYVYPDVMVICGKKQFTDEKRDTLLNPILIIEVLSQSTESYDRIDKFAFYRTIPTLQEYVLIAQNKPRVEKFHKNVEGLWVLWETSDMEGTVELVSIESTLALRDIYAKVEFTQ